MISDKAKCPCCGQPMPLSKLSTAMSALASRPRSTKGTEAASERDEMRAAKREAMAHLPEHQRSTS